MLAKLKILLIGFFSLFLVNTEKSELIYPDTPQQQELYNATSDVETMQVTAAEDMALQQSATAGTEKITPETIETTKTVFDILLNLVISVATLWGIFKKKKQPQSIEQPNYKPKY